MKKFVQLKGYGDQWFWFVESLNDLYDPEIDSLHNRMESFVISGFRDFVSGKQPDYLERVAQVVENPVDYASKFQKYGPLLIREIGSWMIPSKEYSITNIQYSDIFPRENSSVGLVICENDATAEEPWLEYLQEEFPGKNIRLLNLFSTRTEYELDVDLNVQFITFYTTFTSFKWFENILDTIIRNNWTGKKIIGHSIVSRKFPDDIRDKLEYVQSLGNSFKMVKI